MVAFDTFSVRNGEGIMVRRIATVLLLAAIAGFAACFGGGPADIPVPPVPEVTATGPLSMEETDIAGVLDGSDLVLSLVLRREGEGHIAGRVVALVQPVDGTSQVQGVASFQFDSGAETVTVRLPAPTGLDVPATQAAHILRYRVESNVGTLTGLRSLFVVLPKGQVVLLGPKAYTQGESTRVKLFARNPVSSLPLANQNVSLKAVLTVDDNGTPRLVERTINVTTDGFGAAQADLVFDEAGSLDLSALTTAEGGTQVQALATAEVVRLRRVLVTTDKPLYQPGQEMHVRVLSLRKPRLHPDAGAEVLIEVLDGKGNKVFKQRSQASDFGIASAKMQIASQINVGTWKIKATVGDTTTEKAVTVDRYVLPKFNAALALDRGWYLVGSTIKGTVNARYFFGKPVSGGTVKIVFSAFDVDFSDFATVSGATDAEGLYAFSVQLPAYLVGQPLEQGKALVKASLEVTDTAGQMIRKDTAIVVAQSALSVLLIPEGGTPVAGVENVIYVFVNDPAGAPVAADVSVAIGSDAPVAANTDASGVGQFAWTPDKAGATLAVTAHTADGQSVSTPFMLVPGQSGEAVLVRTDKAIYQVGETAAVTILAPDAKDRVYVDFIRSGRVVRQESLDLLAAKAAVEVDLDGEMAGDLVIAAYYLSNQGRIVRNEHVVFVQGADALTVTVTPDKAKYAPADGAKVGIKVTRGTTGQGVVAALGVQVVDEAVYALSDNQPGLLRTYFEIEDAIRQPQYEIHGAAFDLTGIVTNDTQDPTAVARREKEARAAFAALGSTGSAEAASSWDKDLAGAATVLKPFYDTDRTRVLTMLQGLTAAGSLNWDTMVPFLLGQRLFYDFFGNLYRFTSSDNYTVAMRSSGPDERLDTADDWSATFQVWEAMDRGGMEDDWTNGGGPNPGGFADASASADTGAPPAGDSGSGGGDKPRVRNWFPETLYVNPAVITDGNGEATLQFPMADSITEWRLSALANSADGRLGSVTKGMTVFQPFFVDVSLPRVLRRGDEVAFPVAVYNYLDTDQQVHLTISAGAWADLTTGADITVDVPAGAVKGINVGLRAKVVGWHGVTITGLGGDVSDAVMRTVEVLPDGVEVRDQASGRLTVPVTQTINYPETAIPGTPNLLVKVFPGVMSQVVEGLDSILQMPSGCFEQTTATLWPDALVLQYQAVSGKITPEIELKAREFTNLGYQRLLTYECTGGGFTWFGDPDPANLILSGMGIMEFSDIGSVMDIDEAIVPRTADFLRTKQALDGSWHEARGSEFATVQYDDLMTTCFIGWALGGAKEGAGNATSYIRKHLAATSTTYALALCANALAFLDPNGSATTAAFDDLAGRAVSEGGTVHWKADVAQSDCYYQGGGSDVEVTALAVLALLKAGRSPDLVSQALGFLSTKKDTFGNWGTTHATILTLKAFVASLTSLAQDAAGTVTVTLNGTPESPLVVTSDNADVFFQFDLSGSVDPVGPNVVDVAFEGTGTLMYQVVWSHFEPGSAVNPEDGPLQISVSYDKTTMAVNDIVNVTATVTNVSTVVAPMVLVDLGLPPGFDLQAELLEKAVADRLISKFETTDRQIMVYVDAIQPGETLTLNYALVAAHPLKVKCPDSKASLYYDPTSASTTTCAPLEAN
jgi:hypothetical protein